MARREQAARDVLRSLLRDQYVFLFGTRPPPAAQVPVTVRLTADPGRNWELAFDPPLLDQVSEALSEAQAASAACQAGRVYCFRCAGTACEHAVPPTSLAVFRGYAATGVPEWSELVQALMDARDDRVEALYATPPRVLAAVQFGHELRKHQLAAFGRSSRTYAVLGQVLAGYFPVPPLAGAANAAPDRCALTLQAVETRDEHGRWQVRLNVLAAGLTPAHWQELLASGWRPWVARAVQTAGRAIESLSQQCQALRDARAAQPAQPLKRLPAVLGRLARDLEQGARQQNRRTTHAEDRRADLRPVHKAVEDARAADDDRLFVDLKRHTWVACGRQGRAHVFSPEDRRHVTSFVLPPDGAAFRVRTGRWRPMQADEIAAFRRLPVQPEPCKPA
jgi:hypothetical protein